MRDGNQGNRRQSLLQLRRRSRLWHAYIDDELDQLDDRNLVPLFRRVFAAMPRPSTARAFESIFVDDLDNIWVQRVEVPAMSQRRRFDVFNPTGQLLGLVTLPDGFRIFQIGQDFVLGRTTGVMDEPYVELWELER